MTQKDLNQKEKCFFGFCKNEIVLKVIYNNNFKFCSCKEHEDLFNKKFIEVYK